MAGGVSGLRWSAYAAFAAFIVGAALHMGSSNATAAAFGLRLSIGAALAYVALRIALVVRGRRG